MVNNLNNKGIILKQKSTFFYFKIVLTTIMFLSECS
jgi:hypothetical protein